MSYSAPPYNPNVNPGYEEFAKPPVYSSNPTFVPPMVNQAPPPPAGAAPTTVHFVSSPQTIQITNQNANFGPGPIQIHCSTCNMEVLTTTVKSSSAMAWIIGAGLCIFGPIPCACIPCCLDQLQNVEHFCPRCRNLLGRYNAKL
uniref:Lipopolysaccharide-induced tumor necrosis factor-alpha factor homolog n=1 Tax=Caligus clemensi TaxID=344056 RepID=C1C320_CALCM|nr:Lipopolysaccharide-induced tumor necrosis factor-alpha factor homolog [Caligus clemensi]